MAITLNAGSGGSDIHTVTDAASGDEVQVVAIQDEGGDELVVSAAGAASVEVTAALPAGDNNIGNVDIASSVALDASAATVPISPDNTVSTNNSTTTPLGISANYTGTGEDVSDYTTVTVLIHANVDSAADGMTFEFSSDNTNWDDSYVFTFTASEGTARRFQFPVIGQYFRVNYTNGGTGQTTFRVQTIFHRHTTLSSVHRLVDNTSPDRSAQIVKAAVIAQGGGVGNFVPVQATTAGNLKVSLQEASDGLDIGAGNAGTETLRVSIATDDVNLSGILADTANMDTNLGTVAGAVAAGQMQVDIVADGAGLATAANQLPDGHAVTVDNAAGASAVNIQDGGNKITVDWNGTDPPIGAGTEAAALRVTVATDSTGTLTVDNAGTFATQATLQASDGTDIGDVDVASIAAGANLIGDVGLSGARTSGGTTLYKNIDVDETEDEIKGTAGQVYWIHAVNLSASALFLKLYNATAATVTVGSTVPDLTFPIPTQGDTNGAGFTLSIPNGIAFGTAITIAATTGVADNDAGAPGANACVVNLGYA